MNRTNFWLHRVNCLIEISDIFLGITFLNKTLLKFGKAVNKFLIHLLVFLFKYKLRKNGIKKNIYLNYYRFAKSKRDTRLTYNISVAGGVISNEVGAVLT